MNYLTITPGPQNSSLKSLTLAQLNQISQTSSILQGKSCPLFSYTRGPFHGFFSLCQSYQCQNNPGRTHGTAHRAQ